MLLTIIVLTSLIKSVAMKINKDFKYNLKSNILYIIFTLIVIKSKLLFEIMFYFSNSLYFALNTIIVILLIAIFILLLKKSNHSKNEFMEKFIIILKTILVISVLPIIQYIIKFDFGKVDYFFKDIVDRNIVDLSYIIVLFVAVVVASVLYKRKSDKDGLVEHVLLLSILFAVIPTLISDIYNIVIVAVDFVKLSAQVDNAFSLVSGDLRLALFYSIPSMLIAVFSGYIISKNYYKKNNE